MSSVPSIFFEFENVGGSRKIRSNCGGCGNLARSSSHSTQSARASVCCGVRSPGGGGRSKRFERSEEHTSELPSLMRISYAFFCLQKKTKQQPHEHNITQIAQIS